MTGIFLIIEFIWLAIDARKRMQRWIRWILIIPCFIASPLFVPFYFVNRNLHEGETRTGGKGYIYFKYASIQSAILAATLLADTLIYTLIAVLSPNDPDLQAATIELKALAIVIGSLAVVFLVISFLIKRKSIIEIGPTGELVTPCVECSQVGIRKDNSKLIGIREVGYPLCDKCKARARRWLCVKCRAAFIGSLTGLLPPKCPGCGSRSRAKISAIPMPVEIRGAPQKVQAWRDEAIAAANEELKQAQSETARVSGLLNNQPTVRVNYIGGHPNLSNVAAIILGAAESGLIACLMAKQGIREAFTVPWERIIRIDTEFVPKTGASQADAMMAGLVGSRKAGWVGDLAVGAAILKDMTNRDRYFIHIITRTADGFEGRISFESKDGRQIALALNAARQRFAKDHTEKMSSLAADPTAAPIAPAVQGQPDIMDQLKKLAALKEAGVITADEFTAKKVELLSRL